MRWRCSHCDWLIRYSFEPAFRWAQSLVKKTNKQNRPAYIQFQVMREKKTAVRCGEKKLISLKTKSLLSVRSSLWVSAPQLNKAFRRSVEQHELIPCYTHCCLWVPFCTALSFSLFHIHTETNRQMQHRYTEPHHRDTVIHVKDG